MKYVCNLCNTAFVQNKNLRRHLEEFRCKSIYLRDLTKLNDVFYKFNSLVKKNEISTNTIPNKYNTLTTLNTNYITLEDMKKIILKYDDCISSKSKLNNNQRIIQLSMLISDFIKHILCNDAYPENHVIRYISRKPPKYAIYVESENGKTSTVVKNLEESCVLLNQIMYDKLKDTLKQFIKKYAKDDKEDFDYGLYEDTIVCLKKNITIDLVYKAIKCVLQCDILYNENFCQNKKS